MFRKFISYRNEKNPHIFTNKPIYLDLSTLEIRKMVMYDFWYDYEKAKLGSMNIYICSFIIYIKTEDIYVNIVKDIETRDINQIME